MKRVIKGIGLLFITAISFSSLNSCDQKNDTTGEKIEDAADDIGDGIEDAGDDIEDEMN